MSLGNISQRWSAGFTLCKCFIWINYIQNLLFSYGLTFLLGLSMCKISLKGCKQYSHEIWVGTFSYIYGPSIRTSLSNSAFDTQKHFKFFHILGFWQEHFQKKIFNSALDPYLQQKLLLKWLCQWRYPKSGCRERKWGDDLNNRIMISYDILCNQRNILQPFLFNWNKLLLFYLIAGPYFWTL